MISNAWQEKSDSLINKFSFLLREWYALNTKLILDNSLPEDYRFELLRSRQICSALFDAVEGITHDIQK